MLWILQHANRDPDYEVEFDCVAGFVIRAASEFQARQIAQGSAADEIRGKRPDFWTNPEHSTCVPLEPGGVVGIILRDFNAG